MCGRYVTPDTQTIKAWWKAELTKADVAQLIAGFESAIAYHAVSKAVNNARNNDPGLIANMVDWIVLSYVLNH